MKKWVLKAIVQKIISWLPFSNKINYFFQKHITKGVTLTNELFEAKLVQAEKHLGYYRVLNINKGEVNSTLELGTGWFPVIPVCMFLAGADRIITVDISNLIKEKNLNITIEKFIEYFSNGKLQKLFPKVILSRFELIKSTYEETKSGQQTLQKLNIQTLICDARKLPISESQIDLITSNNTFEHIYPSILIDILSEFKRVSKPGGVQSHFIDMSDHFAHLDKSITIYNFLRFSDKRWKFIDNNVQPQNRLRISDYRKLYNELEIPINEEEILPYDISKLEKIKLNKKYQGISTEILAVSHAHLASLMN
ncbi:MAG: hypothetical protein A2W91_14710 [Bacteroidetes bacterium GWF2_38_335]|nr:MAG: hypothetical protein A2W91_14710 [Bacteroidetes bacterium GWF2_38_335]OFY78515.1 MAG: hypothetical protein A2281_16020 [Bacteroidetes bacterium RIFOXYA12_FULL_38_20]